MSTQSHVSGIYILRSITKTCTPARLGEKGTVAKLTLNQIKGISTEKAITIIKLMSPCTCLKVIFSHSPVSLPRTLRHHSHWRHGTGGRDVNWMQSQN